MRVLSAFAKHPRVSSWDRRSEKPWHSVPPSVLRLTPDLCPHPSVSTKSSSRLAKPGRAQPQVGLMHTAILPPPFGWDPAQPGWVIKLPQPQLHTVREAEGGVRDAQPQWPGLGEQQIPLRSRRPPAVQKGTAGSAKPRNGRDLLRSPTAQGRGRQGGQVWGGRGLHH